MDAHSEEGSPNRNNIHVNYAFWHRHMCIWHTHMCIPNRVRIKCCDLKSYIATIRHKYSVHKLRCDLSRDVIASSEAR
jgi:hypothetical protein